MSEKPKKTAAEVITAIEEAVNRNHLFVNFLRDVFNIDYRGLTEQQIPQLWTLYQGAYLLFTAQADDLELRPVADKADDANFDQLRQTRNFFMGALYMILSNYTPNAEKQ